MPEEKFEALREWFRPLPGAITAFSGGVDSSLVLYLSRLFLAERALGCISISPSLKRDDYVAAVAFCDGYGIPLEVVQTREIEDAGYVANEPNRCRHCKTHLYRLLNELRERHPGYVLLNGTNRDDLGDYRPGLVAARAFGVRSPLAECGLSKADVRAVARHFDLPCHDRPASPCLSSRIPYGQAVTVEKLRQIEAAEGLLNRHGFAEVRVRHHGIEARVEVPLHDLDRLNAVFPSLDTAFRQLGFARSSIDPEGLVSGKLNRALGLDADSVAAARGRSRNPA